MPKTVAFDPDAQAFITAAAITDNTQQNAINTLVLALKGYGIWTKFKAIYPIVGGTASQHKYNLKDPRDLNAAFRLTFATGFTHSATGMLPNGTSAFGNTFLAGNLLTVSNQAMSYYSRTNTTAAVNMYEVGYIPGTIYRNGLGVRSTFRGVANRAVSDIALATGTGAAFLSNNLDSTGFYIANRNSNIDNKIHKNGVIVQSGTASIGTPTTSSLNYYISASNSNGTANNFSNRECAFASIGDGLTDTDAANFYTAVQAFNTTLSRQV
tara:strand:+ start:481 stop:1284 length:804 start_codon:yes stop_codon:yes gene_type:complete